MVDFEIPIHFEDLLHKNGDRFHVKTDIKAATLTAPALNNILEKVEDQLSQNPVSITENESFDALFGCIWKLSSLGTDPRQLVNSILGTTLEQLKERATKLLASKTEWNDGTVPVLKVPTPNEQDGLKMILVLLQAFILSEEKGEQKTEATAKVAGKKVRER